MQNLSFRVEEEVEWEIATEGVQILSDLGNNSLIHG